MTVPVYDWIAHHAATRGDCIAIADLATGRRFTYREFDHRVARLAAGLRTRFGIARGDLRGCAVVDAIELGQHDLQPARRDLVDWIENGAYFYVCGDAKTMAKDVRATLVRAFADVKTISAAEAEGAVSALERERRYLQDTY